MKHNIHSSTINKNARRYNVQNEVGDYRDRDVNLFLKSIGKCLYFQFYKEKDMYIVAGFDGVLKFYDSISLCEMDYHLLFLKDESGFTIHTMIKRIHDKCSEAWKATDYYSNRDIFRVVK